MPYTRLHYHLVWGTHGRQPVITEVERRLLREVIVAKSVQLGATVHAVNVVADHAHLLVSLSPTLTVSALVGQVKGASSAALNRVNKETFFRWQAEYGAFTISSRDLDELSAYIRGQMEHHDQGALLAGHEPWW
jgi:putative transposase